MIVHNPNNLPTIPIADLLPTQGDLKDLTEANYEKLKRNIERRGFIDPVSVWEDDKGLKHLLNGHQRQRVLTKEGWNEPVPYFNIPAKSLQEAAAIVLELTSQYGTITQEGLDAMISKYELPEAETYEATSFDALTQYDPIEQDISLPDDGDPDFQQITFTLHNSQKQTVDQAITKAKDSIVGDEPNENANGNALYYLAKVFTDG